MRNKWVPLCLALALLLSLAPGAYAAEGGPDILTEGGMIKLTGDLILTGDVSIAKNTILDLNGYTVTGYETFQEHIRDLDYDYYECPALVIEHGAVVTIRNGTLANVRIENRGTVDKIEALTIDAPHAGGAISNSGTIRTISRCRITAQIHSISNSGDIGLIDNCDVSATVLSAVTNAGGASQYDADGKTTISRVDHCRFVCTDPVRGQGFLSNPPSGITVIEDTVLAGYGRGGIAALDLTLEAKNCVVVNLNEDSSGKSETSAIRIFNQDPGTPPPRLESCTLIALDGACGYLEPVEKEITVIEGGDVGNPVEVTRKITELVYVESMDATNCTFLPLSKVGEIGAYLAWEMEPAPPVEEDGLAHFTAVNTYTPGQFTDVSETYWGSVYIAKAYELGLMKGSSADTFDLEGRVSLAQAITIAARLNSIYETGTEAFSQGSVWYETYVDYAIKNGIIDTPYGDYNQTATRTQFAAILAAALPESALEPLNTIPDGKIPDVPMDSENAAAIYLLYRAGILTGNDVHGTFAPGSSIDRASAAAIITRMADAGLRKSIALEEG